MADLNIRNVDDALVKRLKLEAVERGATLREIVIGKLANGNSGNRATGDAGSGAVVSARRGARVSGGPSAHPDSDLGGGSAVSGDSAAFGKPPITLPRTNVCVNCDHPKHKHAGFGGSCQFEGCLCSTYE
jgi:hypothetical protein